MRPQLNLMQYDHAHAKPRAWHACGRLMNIIQRIGNFTLWFLPAIVGAVLLARVSVFVQTHFAHWLLVPLMTGLILGAISIGLNRLANHVSSNRRGLLMAAAVLAIVVAIAEHAFFYHDFCQARQHEIENSLTFQELVANQADERVAGANVSADIPSVTLMPRFAEYMRSEASNDRTRPLIWALHAGVLIASALGTLTWLDRKLPRRECPL